jgi:predicted signal transduction protein with EAL and GGDEF domain
LLLKEVSKRLESCIRKYDFLARLGGDEFAIIINDLPEETAAGPVAQNILNTLAGTYHIENHSFDIGCSIGVACYPKMGTEQEILTQHADIAMYHAKESGRNNYQYFTEQLLDKKCEKDALMETLKTAISQKQLFLRYKPIYDLALKKIVGVEAALRWKHPMQGELASDQFLQLAEKLGLMPTFQQWFLQTACKEAVLLATAQHTDLKLFISIPCQELLYKDFFETVQDTLKVTGFPAKNLIMELESTEMLTNTYSKPLEKIIDSLTKLGVDIVISDFGMGFSSLLFLKYLPVQGLKISQAFVADLLKNNNDAMIVKSMIALCHNMNLNVIADGVETEEQYQFLLNNGCSMGQGSYLSQALTLDAMTTTLHQQSN